METANASRTARNGTAYSLQSAEFKLESATQDLGSGSTRRARNVTFNYPQDPGKESPMSYLAV